MFVQNPCLNLETKCILKRSWHRASPASRPAGRPRRRRCEQGARSSQLMVSPSQQGNTAGEGQGIKWRWMRSFLFRHDFFFLLNRASEQPGKAKPSQRCWDAQKGQCQPAGSTQVSWPRGMWGLALKPMVCVPAASQAHHGFRCNQGS